MKKSLVFMIAVLLVGALMISCNAEVAGNAAGDGKVVTVGVNLDNGSKALQTSVTNDTNVAGLYWFYTATKTDGSLFITGQTTGKTPVKEGLGLLSGPNNDQPTTLGDFSTGSWTFSFWGYVSNSDLDSTSNKPVYKCENLAVTITANTNLNVTIEAGEGMGAAKLVFNSPTWTYAEAPNGTSLTLKVYDGNGTTPIATGTASTNNDGTATFSNLLPNNLTLTAGAHTLKFRVFYGNEKVGEAELGVVAKNGTTITVSGSIENLDSLNTVTVATVTNTVAVSNEITDTSKTTVTAAVTPASASAVTQQAATNTNVTFAAGVLASEDTTSVANQKTVTSSVLTMDVSSLADANANAGFSVTTGTSAVAAIDLNLTTTTRVYDTTNEIPVLTSESATSVPTFTDYVTVETYIAKGLSEVYVLYRGYEENVEGKEHAIASEDGNHETDGKADMYDANANPSNPIGAHLGYDKATGLLRFNTKHFSEFYVRCADAAYDVNQGKAYSTFGSALSDCDSGDTIVLLKDITDSSSNHSISKAITLDLNGKTITSSTSNWMGYISLSSSGNLSIKDSGSNGTIDITQTSSDKYGIYCSANGTKLTIYSGSIIVRGTQGASAVCVNSNTSFEMKGGSIVVTGDGPTNWWQNYNYYGVNNSGYVEISGGEITASSSGTNYTVYGSGTFLVSGGTITSSNENNASIAPYALNISGSASITGGTIVVDDHDTNGWSEGHLAYGNVSLSGGQFTSTKVLDLTSLEDKLAEGYQLNGSGNTRTVVPAL